MELWSCVKCSMEVLHPLLPAPTMSQHEERCLQLCAAFTSHNDIVSALGYIVLVSKATVSCILFIRLFMGSVIL